MVYADSTLVGSHGSKFGAVARESVHSMQRAIWSATGSASSILASIFLTTVAMPLSVCLGWVPE